MKLVELGSTWLAHQEVPRTGRVQPRWAYAIVIATYLAAFGWGTWLAFEYWLTPSVRSGYLTTSGLTSGYVLDVVLTLLALVIAIPLLALEAPGWATPVGQEPRWRTEICAFGLGTGCIVLGLGLSSLLGSLNYPRAEGPGAAWRDLLSSLLAGPTEEILVLAVPIIFLRAAKWSWWAVIATAVTLRLLFHIYYGPAALVGLGLLALGMAVIYLHTRAILGLILAHSWYDACSTIAGYWSLTVGTVLAIAPIVVALAVYVYEVWARSQAAREQAGG